VETLVAGAALVDQAYAAILGAICNGTLKPGERLTQEGVAQRLNVSRQPIHTALQMLRAQGFVCEAGRRGVAVAPLDRDLFHSIYEFRSAIEPLAVRLAARRISAGRISEGRSLIAEGEAMARRKDIGGMIEADMNFHMFLYELSGNTLVVETMRLNWQHLRRAMGAVLQHERISSRVWKEHARMFKSLSRGEVDSAVRQMEAHIVRAHADLSASFETGPHRLG
jgi:DNA-binding GntR family transcriptional regulator